MDVRTLQCIAVTFTNFVEDLIREEKGAAILDPKDCADWVWSIIVKLGRIDT